MKRGKILIVDDNEDILFTLKMLLRPIAESITTLNDPRELLPIISRTRFDVILLDMNFRQDAVSGKYNPQIEMFAHFKTKSSFHKTKRII